MTIPAKLKAIRESLPKKLTVRELAARMGKPEVPNTYGYYEGASFTKKTLPLDKAQFIAGVFAEYGGDPRDVLALAGLSDADLDAEAEAIRRMMPQAITINLPVTLPSEDRLIAMMEAMLDSADLPHLVDEYAERLARLLPTALAEAASHDGSRSSERSKRRGAPVPDPSTADHDTQQ